MIVRDIKLKPKKKQVEEFERYLWQLTGLYNFISRKIELDYEDNIYHHWTDLFKLINGHSGKIDIPVSVMRPIVKQAYTSWDRYFKKYLINQGLKAHIDH